MRKKIKDIGYGVGSFGLLGFPLAVAAQAPSTPTTYSELVTFVIDMIGLLLPVLFGFLFAFFIWKVIDAWIISAGDETKRQAGKQYVIAAVIAFVVMVSVWGIVQLIKTALFG